MMHKTKITLSITALFACALLWLAGATPAKADADLVASIAFTPPLTDPNGLGVGDTFIATVQMSSATGQVINTWGLYMDFDPAILQANSVTRLYPINGTHICLVPIGFNNTTGQIVGECADMGPSGGTAATNLDVMEIEFEVLQTDTRFDLTFDQVCDGTGSDDCFQALDSGGVNQIAAYNDETGTPLAVTLQAFTAVSAPAQMSLLAALLVSFAVVALGLWQWARRQSVRP